MMFDTCRSHVYDYGICVDIWPCISRQHAKGKLTARERTAGPTCDGEQVDAHRTPRDSPHLDSNNMLALSISRTVQRLTSTHVPVYLRVLAVFDRACDLAASDGNVIALVMPEIGDGPLNIVVKAHAGEWASIEQGLPAQAQNGVLQIGGMQITLTEATIWEPRPDWGMLRRQRVTIARRLPLLQALVHSRAEGLLVSLEKRLETKTDLADALHAGWQGDAARLQRAAKGLAGLGQGLTPAGDDFLCGVMLWAWLAHPTPQEACRVIAEVAAPRTTTLAAAFLRAASRGECSVTWHRLLHALTLDVDDELDKAAHAVLACGETSGADTLAGFLWQAASTA